MKYFLFMCLCTKAVALILYEQNCLMCFILCFSRRKRGSMYISVFMYFYAQIKIK